MHTLFVIMYPRASASALGVLQAQLAPCQGNTCTDMLLIARRPSIFMVHVLFYMSRMQVPFVSFKYSLSIETKAVVVSSLTNSKLTRRVPRKGHV